MAIIAKAGPKRSPSPSAAAESRRTRPVRANHAQPLSRSTEAIRQARRALIARKFGPAAIAAPYSPPPPLIESPPPAKPQPPGQAPPPTRLPEVILQARRDFMARKQGLAAIVGPAPPPPPPIEPVPPALPPAGSPEAIQQARRDFIARKHDPLSDSARNPPPPIGPHDPLLQRIASRPIPAAIQMLERVTQQTKRHRLAESLGFVWSARDINLAWNSVTHSALDPATKQILYNTLWG